jgi:hypothetical protein
MNLVEGDTFVSLACDEALAHNSCEPYIFVGVALIDTTAFV